MDDNRVEGSARNLGGKIQEAVGDFAGDAETKVRGKINQAAGNAQTAFGEVSDEITEFGQMVRETVRDQPLFSLTVGIALGVLIGFFARR